MTIEELKARYRCPSCGGTLYSEEEDLESLALSVIEAVDVEWLTPFQGQKQCKRMLAALDAFNARLASL